MEKALKDKDAEATRGLVQNHISNELVSASSAEVLAVEHQIEEA